MARDRPPHARLLLLALCAIVSASCATPSSQIAAKLELAWLASGRVAPPYPTAVVATGSGSTGCRDLAPSDCLNLDFARRAMADPESRFAQRRFSALVDQLTL